MNFLISSLTAACLLLCFDGKVLADELVKQEPKALSITVGGEVNNKGRFALANGVHFIDALDAAGGLTIFAPDKLRLIRGDTVTIISVKKLRHDGSKGPVLLDGDNIQVPQTYF